MLPYNKGGLISKVSEDDKTKNDENRCRPQPHCHVSPLPEEFANTRIYISRFTKASTALTLLTSHFTEAYMH